MSEVWPLLRPLCRKLALLGWASSAAGMAAGLAVAIASGTRLSPMMSTLQLVAALSMAVSVASFVTAAALQPRPRVHDARSIPAQSQLDYGGISGHRTGLPARLAGVPRRRRGVCVRRTGAAKRAQRSVRGVLPGLPARGRGLRFHLHALQQGAPRHRTGRRWGPAPASFAGIALEIDADQQRFRVQFNAETFDDAVAHLARERPACPPRSPLPGW